MVRPTTSHPISDIHLYQKLYSTPCNICAYKVLRSLLPTQIPSHGFVHPRNIKRHQTTIWAASSALIMLSHFCSSAHLIIMFSLNVMVLTAGARTALFTLRFTGLAGSVCHGRIGDYWAGWKSKWSAAALVEDTPDSFMVCLAICCHWEIQK